MSIKALTVLRLNVAIALEEDIVQVFNRDFTKTFFMLKEDYLAEMENKEGSFYNFKTCSLVRVKKFDVGAYKEFCKTIFAQHGEATPKSNVRQLVLEYIGRMYDGIQFVSSEKQIIPDFYNREPEAEEKKKINWRPEHFLKGTQVTVSPIIGGMHGDCIYPSVFTVQGILQNGPSSYCLITTADEKYSFNISHVESIVSQGKGMIKIQSPRSVSYNEALEYERVERHYSQYAKKGHWLVYGGSTVVTCLAHNLHIPVGAVLDSSSLVNALLDQHFVKNVNAGPFSGRLYLINKKRAKKFVRQNLNRFLSSARKEQDRRDNEMDDYYFREMEKGFDEEFDRQHPEAKESNDQQDTSGRAEVDESYFADHGDASNNDASVDPDGRRLGDYCHPGDIDESYFD